jgi:hypothetical protein
MVCCFKYIVIVVRATPNIKHLFFVFGGVKGSFKLYSNPIVGILILIFCVVEIAGEFSVRIWPMDKELSHVIVGA